MCVLYFYVFVCAHKVFGQCQPKNNPYSQTASLIQGEIKSSCSFLSTHLDSFMVLIVCYMQVFNKLLYTENSSIKHVWVIWIFASSIFFTFFISTRPSVSRRTRLWVGLVGWGTHHIHIPLVSDCTVEPKEKTKGKKNKQKRSEQEDQGSRVLRILSSSKEKACFYFSQDHEFSP